MDPFLIICIIVLSGLMIVVSFYAIVMYSHPDDKYFGAGYFLKFLVVLGLFLAGAQILMLPLDVTNAREGYGFDMHTFWMFIYMLIAIMTTIIIPFGIYLYESDDEKGIISRISTSLCYTMVSFLVALAITLITWSFLAKTYIPVTLYSKSTDYFEQSSSTLTNIGNNQQVIEKYLMMRVTFDVFVICLMSFVGWIMLSIFSSIGLVALPMDLIRGFTKRPKQLTTRQAAENKIILKGETRSLIERGLILKDKEKELSLETGWWAKKRKQRDLMKELNLYKQQIMDLEYDHEIFKLELNIHNTNPLIYIAYLVLGILFSILSLVIWLHVLLYVVIRFNGVPLIPFLNSVLIYISDSNASFIATSIFAGICFYLLFCTMKGNFKVGVGIPFLFTIHPMKVNETFMNSFLFNVLMILYCSVALTQFCAIMFGDYVRLSTIDNLFGIQVKYMLFFSYFYEYYVFEYIFLILTFFSFIYYLFCQKTQDKIVQKIHKLQEEKKKNRKK